MRRAETIQGHTGVTEYAYDAAGRLTSVTTDASPTAQYEYDANGNRLSLSTPAGSLTGAYDAQDRVLQYGSWAFGYTPSGELHTKTNTATGEVTTYSYDALGNLLAVNLADGRLTEYVVDAAGRRVGKKVDGVLRQGFLYRDDLRPVAELDGSGNLVSRLVWADGAAPDDAVVRGIRARLGLAAPVLAAGRQPDVASVYLLKGADVFAIIADHLGSPRLVLNVATGEVAQRLDYDEFGKVTLDTNPGFQPLGFAGGLYDSDTGLVRFGARDYDADVGRWMTREPVLSALSGGNAYLYAFADPVNLTDPTGLLSPMESWVGCIIAANVGLAACYASCLIFACWNEFTCVACLLACTAFGVAAVKDCGPPPSPPPSPPPGPPPDGNGGPGDGCKPCDDSCG
ncbi:MAG: hypothetical protein HY744_05885 [Deltaproteobacteria bacterium]|nr:hypothetical protein [Deltaproteobacteria bacterium]